MKLSADQRIARVVFHPYNGAGPAFVLTLWDTGGKTDPTHYRLAYRLTKIDQDTTDPDEAVTVIFQGSDFGCPIYTSIDSRETVRSVMSFLTCKPGDTDREYFANYTRRQLDYCAQHAEALACAVEDRFGPDQ